MTTVYADAYRFNESDATAALQAAIDSGADRVIVRNQGTPWLISKTIRLKSNQEIDFAPDVIVRAKSGSFLVNDLPLFQALGISNVKLVGEGVGINQATLAMNKSEFSVTKNSYGHIIAVQGTDNFVISGLTLTGAGGDGIIVDSYSYGQPVPVANTLNYSDRGLIDNVTAINNRRNGLSVISAQNLTVQNSKFINSSSENPATGIDFEPDFSYGRLTNINVNNVDVSGNQGNGISLILSALDNSSTPIGININGATVNNNEATGIKLGTYSTTAQPNSNAASSTPNGVINISNVTIAGTKETNTFDNEPNAAISIQALSGDTSDPTNLKVNFSNVSISDTGFNTANPQLSAEPIFIRGFGGESNRNQIGNVSFDNVTVADNFNRSIIGIQLNQPGSFNNITGNIKGINPNGVTANITSTASVTQNNFTLTVTPTTLSSSPATSNDFNGDGKSDILWRNNDGSLAEWQMNSFTATSSSIGALTADWTIAGTGDFSGDGKADLLLSNTDGRVATWQMDGSSITKATTIGTLTAGWSIAGTGDLNGDGTADVILTNTNGAIAEWEINNGTATAKTIGTLTNGWSIAGSADFNGDGKADLLFKNTDGRIAEWQMNGSTVMSAQVIGAITPDWSISATGDFNGDGKADILFRNTNGSVAEWQMNGATVTSTSIIGSAATDWNVAGTGDYNGDGKADILWRNTISGNVAEWQMNGNTVLAAGLTSLPTAASSWNIAA